MNEYIIRDFLNNNITGYSAEHNGEWYFSLDNYYDSKVALVKTSMGQEVIHLRDEDDIIYALKNCFQEKLKYVFGSLKDVKTVKGDKAFQKMMSFIQEKELNYVEFSSSVETWPKAFKKINQIINWCYFYKN